MIRVWVLIAMLLSACTIKNPVFRKCSIYPRLIDDRNIRAINQSNISSEQGYLGTEGVLDCEL